MNRKTKIIVSVVGITIVLLALLGITYAYYLTRIEGNTNTNSISVTTADLKLVYGDGNGLISKSDIMPGTTITKTFTVKNDGDSKVSGYAVVIEEIDNTLTRKDDLRYTLVCKLNDGTNCGGVIDRTYPSEGSTTAILKNDILPDVTHNYTLTVTYVNHVNIDQSVDMGSTINGKINIKDGAQVSSFETNSLAYNLVNKYGGENAITELFNFNTSTTGMYKAKDDYGISYYLRGNIENNIVLFGEYESDVILYIDYNGNEYEIVEECENVNMGSCEARVVVDSSEKFRWRIVRINGDGTIRLAWIGNSNNGQYNIPGGTFIDYNDFEWAEGKESNKKYVGYMYGTDEEPYTNEYDSTIKQSIDNWYETYVKDNFEEYIADGIFCNDRQEFGTIDTILGYNAYNRLITNKQPSFMCSRKLDRFSKNDLIGNGELANPIALLTADELFLAGGINNNDNNYLLDDASGFYTMTPSYYEIEGSSQYTPIMFGSEGGIDFSYNYLYANCGECATGMNLRPVINLKPDVEFTIENDMYVITTN